MLPANPMYAEVIGRYLSWGTQQKIRQDVQETPWVKDDRLVVFDPDLTKPRDQKIGLDEVDWSGKRVHVVRC